MELFRKSVSSLTLILVLFLLFMKLVILMDGNNTFLRQGICIWHGCSKRIHLFMVDLSKCFMSPLTSLTQSSPSLNTILCFKITSIIQTPVELQLSVKWDGMVMEHLFRI